MNREKNNYIVNYVNNKTQKVLTALCVFYYLYVNVYYMRLKTPITFPKIDNSSFTIIGSILLFCG